MWRSVLAALAVTPASMLVGLSLGFTGAGLDVMRNSVKDGHRKVSLPVGSSLWVFSGEKSISALFSGLFCLGAVLGSFLAYPVADRYGRKIALLMTSPLFATGYLTIGLARAPWLLILARVFTGIGTGAASVAVPTYIGEIAPTSIRGILGTFHQLAIAFGAAIAYSFAAFVRTDGDGFYLDLPSQSTGSGVFVQWRTVAFLYLIWCGLMAINALLVPQSPRWLAGRGRIDEALAALGWLRSGRPLEVEVETLKKSATQAVGADAAARALEPNHNLHDANEPHTMVRLNTSPLAERNSEASKPGITMEDIRKNKRQLIVGLGLHLGQQLAAIHAFNFYLSTMLQAVSLESRKTVALVAMVIKFSGNLVLAAFIDRLGRRLPMMVGSFGMGASCLLMGVGYHLYFVKNQYIEWIFILAPNLYCLSYSFGVGAIPWLIMSELYVDKIRAFASSLASATNWLGCFVITFTFDYLVSGINYQGIMWIYASFGFALSLFTVFMLPETKGKTFEEIKAYFDSRNLTPEPPVLKTTSLVGVDALSTLRSNVPEGGARV